MGDTIVMLQYEIPSCVGCPGSIDEAKPPEY